MRPASVREQCILSRGSSRLRLSARCPIRIALICDAAERRGYAVELSVDKRGTELSDPAECSVVVEQLRVLISPGEAGAVERIFAARESDLVAVIDAGNAGERELQNRGELQKANALLILLFSQDTPVAPVFGALDIAASEPRYGAYRVVGADMVHQRVERRAGIVFDYVFNAFAEFFRVRRADKIYNSICKRIVHHAVQLAALEISATVAVAYLVGRVLPDLAVDKCVFFSLF